MTLESLECVMINIKQNSHLFFVGIGGVGMSALALILKTKGFAISGSDRADSKALDKLRQLGITIHIGHKEEHIGKNIDYLIYTNAVDETNPEMRQALKLGVPCIVRAEMLNYLGGHFFSIGVSGTHGKTTTTSIMARIFLASGLDPTLAVGGYLDEIQGAGYAGRGDVMVYEACEAFGSLAHLHPDVSLITNIDEDHMEYFKNLAEVETFFLDFFNNNLSAHSLLIYNADDAILSKAVDKSSVCRRLSVSIKPHGGDFWCSQIQMESGSSSFDVFYQNTKAGSFTLNIPGLHNISNAMLAIAAAKNYGIDNESIAYALKNFKNAGRRFEIKSQSPTLTVIDDYAHHPRAVALTLGTARRLAEERRSKLVVVFQPHLYSRTRYFYKEFSQALSYADSVILADIYAAREPNPDNMSSQIIYDEMLKLKKMDNLVFEKEINKIPDIIKNMTHNIPSIVITLGAGDIWKVSEQILV